MPPAIVLSCNDDKSGPNAVSRKKPSGSADILRPGLGLRSTGVLPALFRPAICGMLKINPSNKYPSQEGASAQRASSGFLIDTAAIRNARNLQKTHGGDHF